MINRIISHAVVALALSAAVTGCSTVDSVGKTIEKAEKQYQIEQNERSGRRAIDEMDRHRVD